MQRLRLAALALLPAFVVPGCEQGLDRADAGAATAMFRGGPAHRGMAEGDAGSAYGGIAWRVRTGGPVRSSPVVSDGVVYVGSSDGQVYALDAQTGIERWAYDAGGPVDASPAVVGGLVLGQSRSGRLFAVDARTGQERWRLATGPSMPLAWEGMSGDLYTASPVVSGRVAVFGAGDGVVYAVEVDGGEVRWRHSTGGRVRSTPAIAGGVVYAASLDGSLYALAIADGRELWRFDTEGRSLDSSRFGYDRRSITSSPAVAEGTVFFGSRDGSLYAVDARSGKMRWRVLHDDTSWSIASPAVMGGLVLDASSDARFFHAVDASTGRVVWRVDVDASLWASPVVAGGAAWFLTTSGELYGVDPTTGTVRERVLLGERSHSSPWIEDGILYVGTYEGSVLAVRLVDPPGLRRAVYWDETTRNQNGVTASEAVRDFFAGRGYAVLGADSLADFLTARIADRARSVVVFAQDQLPASVAPIAADTVLFRRWLDAGGKAVWLGLPPFVWPAGPEGRAYATIDRAATERLLDVDHGPAFFDRFGARVTDAGQRWGLDEWFVSSWVADTASVDHVLALDENGHAAAWIKRYAGPLGTGFFRLQEDGRDTAGLAVVAAVAERFPKAREP